MDEALKKIEQLLAARTPKSRIDPLLPRNVPQPRPEDAMAITHLSKGTAQPAAAAGTEPGPAPAKEAPVPQAPAQAADDIYTKITTGGREFSLDELGSGDSGTEVVDPLMGPVLKSASSYRDVSLDELDVNITPDGPQPRE
jgi:hypothetical protein